MATEHFAFDRGYSDREAGIPRNCPWFDRAGRDGYRNGYNAAKRDEQSPQ